MMNDITITTTTTTTETTRNTERGKKVFPHLMFGIAVSLTKSR